MTTLTTAVKAKITKLTTKKDGLEFQLKGLKLAKKHLDAAFDTHIDGQDESELDCSKMSEKEHFVYVQMDEARVYLSQEIRELYQKVAEIEKKLECIDDDLSGYVHEYQDE